MQVSSILTKARNILKDKWTKGKLYDGERYCALGALGCISGISDTVLSTTDENVYKVFDDESTPLGAAVKLLASSSRVNPNFRENSRRVWKYNDTKADSLEDILSWFDEAIVSAKVAEELCGPPSVEDDHVDLEVQPKKATSDIVDLGEPNSPVESEVLVH